MSRAAGEGNATKSAKKRKRGKAALEAVDEQADDSGRSKFARALGSPDWTTREKGLQVLTRWLTHRENITDTDLNKIWKGLFYAFWHSDKQPVQAALAERLAQILPQLNNEVALSYFRVFFTTMRREWFGIDRLRLDKFMVLVRKVVQQAFVYFRQANWDVEVVEPFMDFLAEGVLSNEDGPPALGLVYHLADCYVPELLVANEADAVPADAAPLLLFPFTRLLADIQHTAGIMRITSGIFQPLLAACQPGEDGAPACSFALGDLARTLFELGAQAEVKAKNREALYQLSKQMQKTARKAEAAAADGAAAGKAAKSASAKPAPAEAVAAPAPASPAAATGASGKKSAKKALSRLARATTAEQPLATPPPPAAASPLEADGGAAEPQAPAASGKKLNKKKKQRNSIGEAAAANGSPAAASGSPEEPPSAAGGRAGLRSRNDAAAAPAQPDDFGTPVRAKPSAAARAASRLANGGTSSEKKSVHFRMKHNLFFEHGGATAEPAVAGPVPSPEIRTPPNARPKGPALRSQAATEPPKAHKRRKTDMPTPKSIPRTKAAAFF